MNSEYRVTSSETKFTNPLLDCDGEFNYINPILEKKLQEKVTELKRNVSINQISVYFRGLQGGNWFGVNEREKFIPAGLNQVPLMLSTFRLIEEHPSVLQDKFLFNETTEIFSKMDSNVVINDGTQVFDIYDVIEYMIKYSHNPTAGFLLDYSMKIDQRLIDNVFVDLGMTAPSKNEIHQLTTKEYASFFRVLYNSSYLSRTHSEKALSILSETDFKDGIMKGIDDNIVIAHKSGFVTDDVVFQLHECGIIYFPDNPYILCVMVRGQNINEMANVIEQISKLTYEEIKSQAAE
ncbi:MAG: class A beta-lactamase-related serine hydrolase [Bacteroidales bacterium]|nr:class A beta-lactamase-related serine hydrolase [Bacteroidales bacterium]